MELKDVFLGNDYEVEFTCTRRSSSDGAWVASTGLGITALFAAASGSTTPIDATLSVALAERDIGGVYYGTIAGSAIAAKLATYASSSGTVHLVGATTGGQLLVSSPRRVRDVRNV